jgi:hypothetical protein
MPWVLLLVQVNYLEVTITSQVVALVITLNHLAVLAVEHSLVVVLIHVQAPQTQAVAVEVMIAILAQAQEVQE